MRMGNRVHQIGSRRLECSKTACPGDGEGRKEGRDASIELAKDIVIGRLLVKNEVRLENDRSTISHHAAFSTARQITSNTEQKSIIREWKGDEGQNVFRSKRSELILQAAANIAGIEIEGALRTKDGWGGTQEEK